MNKNGRALASDITMMLSYQRASSGQSIKSVLVQFSHIAGTQIRNGRALASDITMMLSYQCASSGRSIERLLRVLLSSLLSRTTAHDSLISPLQFFEIEDSSTQTWYYGRHNLYSYATVTCARMTQLGFGNFKSDSLMGPSLCGTILACRKRRLLL
ncbi:hypothetical protein H2248_008643 [Termitomyces sp. 'cryptogamus']|nr:hypothetical protein H2248_008643 [Termitomyces sp. 'cryptogamus']